jgi:tetratricopeptide (TPR) repeat protein
MSTTESKVLPELSIWKAHTQRGNDLMQSGSIETAKTAYTEAIEIAKHLCQQSREKKTNPDTIHLYVIACNNLADCYEASQLFTLAENYLTQAYDITLRTIEDTELPLNFRQEAYRGWQIVLRQLVDFYHRRQNPDAISAIVLKAKQRAQLFLEEVTNN